jgi:Mor family transcriptional regulator
VHTEKNTNSSNTNKKKREKRPLYKVIEAAMRKFKAQLVQNTDTKRKCLNAVISRHYEDGQRFWMDLLLEADRLKDSVKFLKECDGLKLDSQAVAEHLVCETAAVRNDIIKNGLHHHHTLVMMFKERLFLDEDGLFCNYKQITERATA